MTINNTQKKPTQTKSPKNLNKEKLCLMRCKNISSLMYRGCKFTVKLGKWILFPSTE